MGSKLTPIKVDTEKKKKKPTCTKKPQFFWFS